MNTNLNMRTMPIEMLKPAKYNPRKDLKPGDLAYEKIKRSLHDFGYVDPIVWNEVTGNIVGGHQRYKVLKAEGATEVDCVVVHIENPSDEKALNIALNKATGDWEPTALADLLQDLQSAGYDLGATGFDAAEVDDLFSKVHDKDVHGVIAGRERHGGNPRFGAGQLVVHRAGQRILAANRRTGCFCGNAHLRTVRLAAQNAKGFIVA